MSTNMLPASDILADDGHGPGHDPGAPMTAEQADELRELAARAGEPFDGELTQRQAQERIRYLRSRVDE